MTEHTVERRKEAGRHKHTHPWAVRDDGGGDIAHFWSRKDAENFVALQQQRDDLLAALEPFAEQAVFIYANTPDKAHMACPSGSLGRPPQDSLTAGDFRAAAEAARKAKEG